MKNSTESFKSKIEKKRFFFQQLIIYVAENIYKIVGYGIEDPTQDTYL